MLQDGSEGSSLKREQSAAIDIPTPRKKDSTQDCCDTQDSNKSTNSTLIDTPKDVPPKPDEGTPPHPLPVSEPAMFERRYSEPVDMIGAEAIGRGGGPEQPGSGGREEKEGKERVAWSKSAHQLVTSSLPNSSVAIQIEVGDVWNTFSYTVN